MVTEFSWAEHVEITPTDLLIECQELDLPYAEVVERYLTEDFPTIFGSPAPEGARETMLTALEAAQQAWEAEGLDEYYAAMPQSRPANEPLTPLPLDGDTEPF